MKQKLVIVRGLPGSGKSTFAGMLAKNEHATVHRETDMFWLLETGKYVFDGSKLKEAHAWCLAQVSEALNDGLDVVVSNTFTQNWEMKPYMDLNHGDLIVGVVETQGRWTGVHDVPIKAYRAMDARWENIPESDVEFEMAFDQILFQLLK